MASGPRPSALCFTLSLVLWFCVLIRAQETTTELPTTTPLPDGDQRATVGWVSNPRRRGTLTLLIECLTTIFACTWTVLHLNVPAITDSTMTRVLRKAKWMAITVLFPEFIFAKAVCELRFALEMLDWVSYAVHCRPDHFQTVSKMKNAGDDGSAWVLWAWTVKFEPLKRILYTLLMWKTPYHSRVPLAVVEKGKVVKEGKTFIEKSFSEKDRPRDGRAVLRVQKWTLSHAYYANMGGIVARKRMYEFTADNKESFVTHLYSVVRGDHLARPDFRAWELGHPLKELRLSEDDIKDKSKADWVVKTIAVIQIARLLFDLVTRGFPTPVEELAWRIAALVSTVSPILALAGSFAILQYRPRNLKRKQAEAVEETLGCLSCRGDTALTTWNIDDDWWKAFTTALYKSVRDLMWVNKSRRHEEHHLNTVWNIARELKTSAGQNLALRGEYEKWDRDASTHPSLKVGPEWHPFEAPEGMFQWFFSRCAEEPASVQSYQEAKKVWDIHAQRLLRVLNISSGIIYTAARLILFGIMFSSLRAVPDGVYDTANWTRFVPSFS
ncbi:hypothetical protein NCU08521 [Neurospora crassa OR74A]|uniref:DUF4220 domain-containing protein n=1 Tax=Neurospora crassa (strain ATCC 24698 / 74-OR23-1A / CBS 708.71 / DSM 1257 / FGSC 987) TaxID=367110 RepID=Q7SAW0_NEUCR|nr:hypothetical protein NCU08521 [Neurospora crassa OR74A]EAA33523.1 hypothetical protein NCU08521 [Neurospora crassa OR74A]|eukprot:XP_962759.1 hypothetical protein NCU08521 [Neurospora crassa OR74A]